MSKVAVDNIDKKIPTKNIPVLLIINEATKQANSPINPEHNNPNIIKAKHFTPKIKILKIE